MMIFKTITRRGCYFSNVLTVWLRFLRSIGSGSAEHATVAMRITANHAIGELKKLTSLIRPRCSEWRDRILRNRFQTGFWRSFSYLHFCHFLRSEWRPSPSTLVHALSSAFPSSPLSDPSPILFNYMARTKHTEVSGHSKHTSKSHRRSSSQRKSH